MNGLLIWNVNVYAEDRLVDQTPSISGVITGLHGYTFRKFLEISYQVLYVSSRCNRLIECDINLPLSEYNLRGELRYCFELDLALCIGD